MNIKEKIIEIIKISLHTPLPPALAKLRFKRLALGLIALITTIAGVIVIKQPGIFSFLLVAVAFVFTGLKISYEYATGQITEYSLICLTVKQQRNNTFSIVFEDDNKETQVFIHNSKKEDFYVDVRYRFYTEKSNPTLIIAYEQI